MGLTIVAIHYVASVASHEMARATLLRCQVAKDEPVVSNGVKEVCYGET
jgi:hypothetical protein